MWDDYFFIETNEAIRSPGNIPRMFTDRRAQASFDDGFMVFRPLRTVHYRLLYLVGGGELRPWLFHAANVAWHAAAACLVFGVTRRLLVKSTVPGNAPPEHYTLLAAIAGLTYAVHPVLSETVCWAKGLDDVMAAVFVLLATRLLLDWRGDWQRYAGATLAFAAALYSKESAVPWVVFAGLLFWLIHRRGIARSAMLAAPLVTLTILFIWHRHVVMGRSSQTEPISGTYGQTLLDMFATVIHYARLLLGVPPFCIDYSYMPGGHAATSFAVWPGIIGLSAAIAGTIWALTQPRWRLAGLGGAWFFLFMLPVSNLVPMLQYMAERFLYLPLAGLLPGVFVALLQTRRPRVVAGIGAVIVALLAVVAWGRSWIWEDELTLFIGTRLEAPPMERVENNAVAAILRQPHMREVFKLIPHPGSLPRIAIAPATVRTGANVPRVIATLREMQSQFPDNAVALEATGAGLAALGLRTEGAAILERAVQLDPRNPGFVRNLGILRFDDGQFAAAIAALEKALDLFPSDRTVMSLLARAAMKTGDFKRAAALFDKLAGLEPDNPDHVRNRDEARAKAAAP